eukprot:3975804-Pleurochrysis_carterae.AAC.7
MTAQHMQFTARSIQGWTTDASEQSADEVFMRIFSAQHPHFLTGRADQLKQRSMEEQYPN